MKQDFQRHTVFFCRCEYRVSRRVRPRRKLHFFTKIVLKYDFSKLILNRKAAFNPILVKLQNSHLNILKNFNKLCRHISYFRFLNYLSIM